MAKRFAFAHDENKELKLQRNQQNKMQTRSGEFALESSIWTLCQRRVDVLNLNLGKKFILGKNFSIMFLKDYVHWTNNLAFPSIVTGSIFLKSDKSRVFPLKLVCF